MGKRILKDREQQILDLYSKGGLYKDIAAICNCSTTAVRYIITNNGGVLKQPRKFPFKEDFFHIIDTEEKAYWLGFIGADGVLYDNNQFKLQLAPQDRSHLQKLLNSLESNHLIHESRSTLSNGKTYLGYQFTITSAPFAQDLIDKGVTPRKSLTLQPYIIPDNNLQRHYWRGFIDGDGSILRNRCGYTLQLVGNMNVVTAFKTWAGQYISTKKTITKHSSANAYYFCLGKKSEVITLLQVLYSDCNIALDRKKEKSEEALKFWSPTFS